MPINILAARSGVEINDGIDTMILREGTGDVEVGWE
jgi:hypothetical protein